MKYNWDKKKLTVMVVLFLGLSIWGNVFLPRYIAEGGSQFEWQDSAVALILKEDLQGLLEWCQERTKSEPENAAAWFALGAVYAELNRYHKAIDAYRQAIRINPENADAWYRRPIERNSFHYPSTGALSNKKGPTPI